MFSHNADAKSQRITRTLNTLGYMYSCCVFIGAVALAALYHTGQLDTRKSEHKSIDTISITDQNENSTSRKPTATLE